VDLKSLEKEELKNLELIQKFLNLLDLNLKISVSQNMIQSLDNKKPSSTCIIEDKIIFKRNLLKDFNLFLNQFLLSVSKIIYPNDEPLDALLKTCSDLIVKISDVRTYKLNAENRESVLGKLFKKFK
jgi:hypothetical protein